MTDELKNIVEAVLLAAEGPLSVAKIQGLFDEGAQPEASEIKNAIAQLDTDCESRGIEIRKIGSGYRFQTREKYADWVRKLLSVRPPRLSRALLETLAIIAYRQPVSRGDIEDIRGVAVSADIMQRLQERDWVKQVGVRDVPGRPALFGTTPEFLAYFNLSSLKDLPELMEERDLGQIASEMETPLPPEVLQALQLAGSEQESSENQSDIEEAIEASYDEPVDESLEDMQSKSAEECGDQQVLDTDTESQADQDNVDNAASAEDPLLQTG
ncbi:MAG: SMC-Scp complex subunit ScpB [Pseudomonadota bacterium]